MSSAYAWDKTTRGRKAAGMYSGGGMTQTRLESFIEAMLNTMSGFIVSYVFWVAVVVPMFHMALAPSDNLAITGMFTVLSVVRSYLWRRFFNAGVHKLVNNLLRRKS